MKLLLGVVLLTTLLFSANESFSKSKRQDEVDLKKYKTWNKQYPADAWGKERNKRITKIQGNTKGSYL